MSRQALPDFQQPIGAEGLLLYYPYEGNGPFRLLPDQLTIATTGVDGTDMPPIDFQLTFVRGPFPNRPPEPHGRLAFGMQPHFDLAAALDHARQLHPAATVAPIHVGRGSLRLLALNTTVAIPPELLEPIALQWADAAALGVQFTLSPTAATFLRDALQGELLPLSAYVELEFQGVAPRLPLQVSLKPQPLLADLLAMADGEERLPRAAMIAYVLRHFDQPQPDLPFHITGAIAEEAQGDFAEALVDRLVARLGHFVPAAEMTQGGCVQLLPWRDEGEAEFHWELDEPMVATRRMGLTLDPFAAAQQVVQAYGIAALYQEHVVPALPTGMHQLYVSTNFPAQLRDVVTTGVRIRVPSRPPYRYYEIVEALENLAQLDEQTVLLRLSFREPLGYFYSTFLVVNGADGSAIVRGAERWHDRVTLRLTAADYPVQLATLSATSALFALATLGGVIAWREADTRHETTFAFDDTGSVTLLLPQAAEDARISLHAIHRETAATLTLSDLPFQDAHIGRYSFPTYGSHTVEITCLFGNATPPQPSPNWGGSRDLVDDLSVPPPHWGRLGGGEIPTPPQPSPTAGEAGRRFLPAVGQTDHATVELLPEALADSPENRTTLHFTADQPRKLWRWFAESPFAGGYRYRRLIPEKGETGTWSAVQSPLSPVTIAIGAPDMDGTLPGDERHDDLLYYPDPDDPERFFYLPGAPLPVLDPQGRPMLSLLIAGSSGFLQLDVRWQAPTETLDALRRAILAHHPALNPALLRLTFAPVTVEQIALLLTTEPRDGNGAGDEDGMGDNGSETLLATSQSSGVPPYNGLFSVAVNAEQQDLVIGALHQRADFLRVRYRVTRQVAVTATVAIEGDVQMAFTELTATSTVEACRDWVVMALAADRLQQQRSGAALVPATLWERTAAAATDQAAQWIYRHLPRLPTDRPTPRLVGRATQEAASLTVTATLSDTLDIPLIRTADISTWFADGSGDDHIRVVG